MKTKNLHYKVPVRPACPVVATPGKSVVAADIAVTPVEIDEQIRDGLLSQIQEEGFVTVHCSYSTFPGDRIRIWNSTFLIDHSDGNRSKLLHAIDITFFPVWMEVPAGTTVRFTLFFAPLARGCRVFDLFEDIPETGGFEVRSIRRNKRDIYYVHLY